MEDKTETTKSKKDKLNDKMNDIKAQNRKSLSDDIANTTVTMKEVGHMIKQLPKAMAKRNEAKKNGEIPQDLFDYIEDPEFDHEEEALKVSEKVEKFMGNLEGKIENFTKAVNPIYIIKKIIDKIKGENVKMLPSGQETEKQSGEESKTVVDKKAKMFAELKKGAPSLQEQKEDSIERANRVNNEEMGIDTIQTKEEEFEK